MGSSILILAALIVALIAILVAFYAVANSFRANARARRAHSLFLMRQIYHLLEESIRTNHIRKSDISVKAKKLQVIIENGFSRTVRVVDDEKTVQEVGLYNCPVLSSENLEWEVFSSKVNRLRRQILNIPPVQLQQYIHSPEYSEGQTLLDELKNAMLKDIDKVRSLPT